MDDLKNGNGNLYGTERKDMISEQDKITSSFMYVEKSNKTMGLQPEKVLQSDLRIDWIDADLRLVV